MTVMPKKRREGQNTGRRAKAVRHVQDARCPKANGENHRLVWRGERICCAHCKLAWSTLDLILNPERGAA